jgi:membrane protease YdiL (CAAX protease family)
MITASFLLLITILFARLLSGINFSELDITNGILSSKERMWLKLIQALQHISIFLIPSLFISYLMTGNILKYQGLNSDPGFIAIALVLILSIILIMVTSFAGYLNSQMELPDWFSGLDSWINERETEASSLTGIILYASTPVGLFINLIILAAIPAIGEELLFRGIFQQIFQQWLKSSHLAVWIVAALFSAVHIQFLGFLPRFILGLVFGYLFLWSKSLWLPVMAHFLNNSVAVCTAYFYGWENLNEGVKEMAPISGYKVIIPLGLVILIMYLIYDYYRRRGRKDIPAT